MATLLVAIFYTQHIFACVFGLMTTFQPKALSWYGAFGYCDVQAFEMPLSYAEAEDVVCAGGSEGQLYLQASYWALGLVLGFASEPMRGPYEGTVDPNRFTEYLIHEQVLFLVLQLLGAFLWAYVTARLVDVIVNANPEATRFRQSIDELNRFCSFNKLPKSMEIRLREYYIKRKQITQAESRQTVAEGLSPMLQGEVAWHINAGWLERIPFLNHDVKAHGRRDPEMQKLRIRVALSLRPNVYAPNESPPVQRLYVIFNGLARYRGETLHKGDHWGEWDVLLRSNNIRRRKALAINYLSVLMIDSDMIEQIALEFPEAYRYIRRWVGWRSLSEYLLDRLRCRRRNMTLLVKRWQRRYPALFYRMRCFMWALYLLMRKPDQHSHRGKLAMRSELSHFGSGKDAGKGHLDYFNKEHDEALRLELVNRQLRELLDEQLKLTARIATRDREAKQGRPPSPVQSQAPSKVALEPLPPTQKPLAALPRAAPLVDPGHEARSAS